MFIRKYDSLFSAWIAPFPQIPNICQIPHALARNIQNSQKHVSGATISYDFIWYVLAKLDGGSQAHPLYPFIVEATRTFHRTTMAFVKRTFIDSYNRLS